MANDFESITNSFKGLDISSPVLEDEEALNLPKCINRIDDAGIQLFRQAATDVADVKRIIDATVAVLNEALENSVVGHLIALVPQDTSYISPDSRLPKLRQYFNDDITKIARGVLHNPQNRDGFLWKTAEECYNQAICQDGTLYVGNRTISVDEDSPAYLRATPKTRQENVRNEKERWRNFWAEALRRSPGGPTLFYPPAVDSPTMGVDFEEIPQYLFRTFDQKSSGINNTAIIASQMSIDRPKESRTDILSVDNRTAENKLGSHLQKSFFSAPPSDNLVSWTSSILFALQYALYRSHLPGLSPADIKICAVETGKFPQGQFARDMWLIRAYRETATMIGGDTRRFFQFRYDNQDYYNGEYLSQGLVTLSSRSSIVSLETLIQSGLYSLYPDLTSTTDKLANRVRDLRDLWGNEIQTTLQELENALEIAKTFNALEALDIAVLLLSLKHRKYKSTVSQFAEYKHAPELTERSPPEIRRFLEGMYLMTQCRDEGALDESTDMWMLQQVFEWNN
ncbi:hypothetical protein F4678DRAFT_476893 [Xylaria arbuscula]|nr:hypothetical protein F4678DRAFT_476893 [Xylaria arbuscula]